MEIVLVKKFLDSCHEAKRIIELMPELPRGMSPRHIQVLDVLHHLNEGGREVKISDISSFLKVTRPSITKLIHELEALGAVRKIPDDDDRRVVKLVFTDLGLCYYDFYIRKYHKWLAEQFSEISPEAFQTAIDTIHQVYEILNTRKMEEEWNG